MSAFEVKENFTSKFFIKDIHFRKRDFSTIHENSNGRKGKRQK